jgi:leader peptidase (prepilin peptidase)/N-methyltransferase
MEISAIPIYILITFFILFNAFLHIAGQSNILLFEQFRWNPLSNIYAGIIGTCISVLIYMLSNRKGLGEGDIYLFALMGLILGMERIVFGFYLTLISALIFSAIQITKRRSVNNIHIPFVPFIVFGALTAILLHESYMQLRTMLSI